MSDHIVFGGRCSGKTTRLLDEAKRLAGEGRQVVFISQSYHRSVDAQRTFTRLQGRPPHGITFASVDALLAGRLISLVDAFRGSPGQRYAVLVDDVSEMGLGEVQAAMPPRWFYVVNPTFEIWFSGVPNSDLTHWFNAGILTLALYGRSEFLAPSAALIAQAQTLNPRMFRSEILGEVTAMPQIESGNKVKLVVADDQVLKFLQEVSTITYDQFEKIRNEVGVVEDYGSPFLVDFDDQDEELYIPEEYLVLIVEPRVLPFGTPVEFDQDGTTTRGFISAAPDDDGDYTVRYLDEDGDESYEYHSADNLIVKANGALLDAVNASTVALFERFSLGRTPNGTQAKLREEFAEFVNALVTASQHYIRESGQRKINVADEFGDLLVTAINAAAAVGISTEALVAGVERTIAKNDAKNYETHKLESGFIVRR